RGYVRGRNFPLPTYALNMDIVGQDSDYMSWTRFGGLVNNFPVAAGVNEQIKEIVLKHTEADMIIKDSVVLTDSEPFLSAGIRGTTLASLDKKMGMGGFHRPTDNMSRVKMERLPELTNILVGFLGRYDQEEFT
ncbi:MAG: hypothetical protein N2D54_03115, partial [Chloroflexota bacterium]